MLAVETVRGLVRTIKDWQEENDPEYKDEGTTGMLEVLNFVLQSGDDRSVAQFLADNGFTEEENEGKYNRDQDDHRQGR